MKRHAITMLRLTLALAGVAYIVWSLTWTDQVVLPTGYPLPAKGAPQGEPVSLEVVSAPAELVDAGAAVTGEVVVRLPEAWGGPPTMMIDASELGVEADDVRFKPGIVTTLGGAAWGLVLAGLLLVGLLPPLQTWRWHQLMRCRGLDPGFGKALRLMIVGMFFNLCMPGMTGGDVVKAYYAAKGSGQRGSAVMSVILDRVSGLLAMVLLAGLMGLLMLDDPLVWKLTVAVWLSLGGLLVAGGMYFSGRVRRWLGIQRMLERMNPEGLLRRIDAAAVAYRDHPGTVVFAVLVSLPAHLAQMTAAGLAGLALGMDVSFGLLLTVLPIVFFAGAMPISYQGLGVMEAAAMGLLLDPPAATANQIVGMLVLARLYIAFYSLIGALMLLRGDIHLFPQEVEQVMAGDGQAKPTTEPAPAQV